jgi:hypothetical protein
MRFWALLAALFLAGCASGGRETCPGCGRGDAAALQAKTEAYDRQREADRQAYIYRDLSPAERTKRTREDELLERALTSSPDYMAALRRAAVANVDAEEPPAPAGRRNRAAEAQAREQRITAEEARLSDAVELRRRSRLAQQGQNDRAARLNAARAACDAQASSVGAGIYTPYSHRQGVLGSALTGAIASASAEEQARAGCYRAYGL